MIEQLKIKAYSSSEEKIPLAILIFSDKLNEVHWDTIKDEQVKNIYARMLEDKEIKGDTAEVNLIYTKDSEFSRCFFIGLGKNESSDIENFRLAGAALCKRMRKYNLKKMALKLPGFDKMADEDVQNRVQAFTEGFMLRNYDFSKYLQKPNEPVAEELLIIDENSALKKNIEYGIKIGESLSKSTYLCRDIANEPANYMTPEEMSLRAGEIAKEFSELTCKVFGKEDLEKFGMGCFLGVAKAGGVPPRMIVLEYKGNPDSNENIALVGKGVTFDSGGISLKMASGMFHMKRDLSGAAAVIATMRSLAELKLKINVVGVVGSTENMPGVNAYKPGDILRSMSGKTVEIINTDAEGRLILADLLTYVQRSYKLESVIDVATLTGAVQRALGGAMSGAFTNNKELLSRVAKASEKANEPVWELPLAPKLFKKANKSYFADLKNSSDKPPGGTKAALFLYEFIENDIPWVHLDIAGTDTASGEPSSYYPRGATGVATRTLIEFLRNSSI